MFNIPPDIFNRMQGMNQPQQGGTFTPSGKPYNGPFGNNTNTPFRTIRDTPDGQGAGAYGRGLNASAAQLYDHARQDGGWAVNAGLPRAGMTQTLEDFANRGSLAGPSSPAASGPLQWGGLTNNSDVLKFMQQENALSEGDLDWMGKWFNESGINGGKDFLTGNVRGWDYQNSGLTDQNKGIVGNAMSYLGNYWKPWEEEGAGMPADPPKSPAAGMNGGIFNMNPMMRGMR